MSDFIEKILFEGVLLEVGELNNTVFRYEKIINTTEIIQYSFVSSIGNCKVRFVNWEGNKHLINQWPIMQGKTVYNIGFSVEGTDVQHLKTNYKILIDILSTVSEIIVDFTNEYSPQVLLIRGNFKFDENTEENEGKKSILYGAIIDKNLYRLPGYKMSTVEKFGGKYYYLYK